MPGITKVDIIGGLRELGVSAGMGLMVHSSMRSFGCVDGGPHEVIAALTEVLTVEGTLVLPSFNHGEAFGRDGPGYYDPTETRTRNGLIPDTFWRMPGVSRSLNPTHPFAAWGKNARRYTERHHRTLVMGPGSPLELLCREGGYGLLIGVGYESNSLHHVAEICSGAPCLGRRTEAYPVLLPGGRRVLGRTWGWREGGCPFGPSKAYAPEMERRGLHRRLRVGASTLTFFKLMDAFDLVSEMLANGWDGIPPCSRCPVRPRRTPNTVTSDWDDERGCPLPDSEAWSY